jgi:hypothetical protein
VVQEQQAIFLRFSRSNLCLLLAPAACDCQPDRAVALLGPCYAIEGSAQSQAPSNQDSLRNWKCQRLHRLLLYIDKIVPSVLVYHRQQERPSSRCSRWTSNRRPLMRVTILSAPVYSQLRKSCLLRNFLLQLINIFFYN